jgi:hypothetical protein
MDVLDEIEIEYYSKDKSEIKNVKIGNDNLICNSNYPSYRPFVKSDKKEEYVVYSHILDENRKLKSSVIYVKNLESKEKNHYMIIRNFDKGVLTEEKYYRNNYLYEHQKY